MDVKVVTEETYRSYGGVDLTAWDQASSKHFRVLRKSTLQQLAEKVGEGMGCEPIRIRFWNMVNRQNKTNRPDLPINDPSVTVESIQQKAIGSKNAELRLWAEASEEVDENGLPMWPAHLPGKQQSGLISRSDLIVLFLKHFDIENQTLSGAGHIYIKREKKVEDLGNAIIEKMRWSKEAQLKLFEVIKLKPASFHASNIA